MGDNSIVLFKLKQHTPMIHFHGEQSYAGLRATEVKPKLDRFLCEKLTNKIGEEAQKAILKSIYKPWLVGSKKEYPSFNYKLIIGNVRYEVTKIRNVSEDRNATRDAPMFFGNMGIEYDQNTKFLVLTIQEIPCKIICLNNENIDVNEQQISLKELIENNLPSFLLENNFGTRQSKGYGSFYLSDSIDSSFTNNHYNFFLDVSNNSNLDNRTSQLFDAIELFYKTLRSGINRKGRGGIDEVYFKSLMFQYAKNELKQWDKKTIREHFLIFDSKYKSVKANRTDHTGTVQYNAPKDSGHNHYNFRDMLGLSSKQEWQYYNEEIKKEMFNSRGEVIDRYSSPILFKPLYDGNRQGYIVFIVLKSIPDDVKFARTKVTAKKSRSGDLMLDMYQEFELKKYLDFAINKFESSESARQFDYSNNVPREVPILEKIYHQLKSQTRP